jgi:biopolymer transport protein ExbD
MAFASFDKQRANAPLADINMVPLIDVMLVLLVIFIVTAPLLTHAVKLQLPQASAHVSDAVPNRVEVAIDATGQRFWNGEALTRAQMAERFADLARQQPPPEVHLRADQDVPYRHVAQTLADTSRAGLSRVGFVSEPEAGR